MSTDVRQLIEDSQSLIEQSHALIDRSHALLLIAEEAARKSRHFIAVARHTNGESLPGLDHAEEVISSGPVSPR
jgi:hypothetical protein